MKDYRRFPLKKTLTLAIIFVFLGIAGFFINGTNMTAEAATTSVNLATASTMRIQDFLKTQYDSYNVIGENGTARANNWGSPYIVDSSDHRVVDPLSAFTLNLNTATGSAVSANGYTNANTCTVNFTGNFFSSSAGYGTSYKSVAYPNNSSYSSWQIPLNLAAIFPVCNEYPRSGIISFYEKNASSPLWSQYNFLTTTTNSKASVSSPTISLADGKTYVVELQLAICCEHYYTSTLQAYHIYIVNYQYEFTVDRTAPTQQVKNSSTNAAVTSDSFINYGFTVSASDTNFTALYGKKDTATYSSLPVPSTITATSANDGVWSFYSVDKVGNQSSTFTLTMDSTKPTGGFTDGYGTAISNITRSSFTFTGADTNFNNIVYTYPDGSQYTSTSKNVYLGASSGQGTYTFKVNDKAGNSATFSIILDTTSPSLTLYKNNVSVFTNTSTSSSNIFYSYGSSIKFTATDNQTVSHLKIIKPDGAELGLGLNAQLTFNNQSSYPAGLYSATVYDTAGNSSSIDFYVDYTAAALTIDSVVYYEGGATSSAATVLYFSGSKTINWRFRNGATDYAPSTVYITSTGYNNVNLSYTSTTTSYTISTATDTKTTYSVFIEDTAGNKAYFTLIVTRIMPSGNIYANGNNITPAAGGTAYTNQSIYLSYNSSDFDCIYSLDGVNQGKYTSSTTLTADGTYVFSLSDPAGNKTTYTVEINRTSFPTGTLTANGSTLANGGATRYNVTFNWSEANCTATLNGSTYSRNTAISTEGSHTIVLTNQYGNKSTYTFKIDKTAPVYYFTNSANAVLNKIIAYNIDLKIMWDENNCTAKLNGADYSKGSIVSAEGSYSFVLTDAVGNSTAAYAFEIDKTPDRRNYDYFIDTYKTSTINRWWESYQHVFAENKYNIGTAYSFSNMADVYSFAINREWEEVEQGIWFAGETIYSNVYQIYVSKYESGYESGSPYRIYKNKAGGYIAYFNTINLNDAIDYYAAQSITERYLPTTPAAAYPGDGAVPAQNIMLSAVIVRATTTIGFYYQPSTNTLKINGVAVPYSTTLMQGSYDIIETDRAGNEWRYTLIIDSEAPKLRVMDLTGNRLSTIEYHFETRTEIRVTTPISVYALDNFDGNCLLTVTNDAGESFRLLGGAVFKFNLTGRYTLVTRDRAGNVSVSWTLFVSLEAFSTAFIEEYASDETLTGFTLNLSRGNSLNSLNNIFVYLYNETTGVYQRLSSDDYSTAISTSSFVYRFNQSGRYRVELEDNFGRTLTSDFEMWRSNPVGKLFVDGIQIPNGQIFWEADGVTIKSINPSVTNKSVYLTWRLDAAYTAELIVNDNKYEYMRNTVITASGVYILRLTNTDGKFTDFVFQIDKTPPVGNFVVNGSPANNGVTTNGEAYFTWTEASCTAMLNGSPYGNSTILSNEGSYTIVLIDRAGNSSQYTITIDRTPPAVKLFAGGKEFGSGSTVNKNAYFSWTEGNCTAYLNGAPYASGASISQEGSYILLISDRYGNSATFSMFLDKTAPDFKLFLEDGTELEGEYYINKSVYILWDESNVFAAVNGVTYYPGNLLSLDGVYTFSISDMASNVSSLTITINKSAPVGTLKSGGNDLANNSITKYSVTFSWTESNCTATLNGSAYAKGATISQEGIYTILLRNRYGTVSEYIFEIDKTAPTGILTANSEELSSGAITKYTVFFNWEESNCRAFLNGAEYMINTPIELTGAYTLLLCDQADNVTTYNFTINKTAPNGTFSVNGAPLADGGATRYTVAFNWTEAGCTATLNGNAYTKGAVVRDEGFYTVVLTNAVGTSSTFTFTIDRTAPTARILAGGEELESGSSTRSNATLVWDELNCTVTLNGNAYTGEEIEVERLHTFVITDAAGNSTTYTVIIDKTSKNGTIVSNNVVIESGSITRFNTYFTWSDTGCTATLNGAPYAKNTVVTAEGEHIIILRDAAGNDSVFIFEIDKTPPSGFLSLENPSAPGLTNDSASFAWFEDGCSALLNYGAFTSGTIITDEGVYTITLTDRAGNSSVYTFEIDKTAPIGTLTANSATLTDGGVTRHNVSFNWSEVNCTATLNGDAYSKNAIITTEGKHRIVITDRAGNSAIYTFEIKKTAPQGFFAKAEDFDITNISTLINGAVVSYAVLFISSGDDLVPKLNGADYEIGTTIELEGEYVLILTDRVGNSNTYTITLKKTPPSGTLIANGATLASGGTTRYSVNFSWSEANCTATLDGKAYTKGSLISTSGTYTIILTDRAGNSSTYSFTIVKEKPIVSAQLGDATLEAGDLQSFTSTVKKITDDIAFFWDLEAGYTATLNDEEYLSGALITGEGQYRLVITDSAGNAVTYMFSIQAAADELTPAEQTESILAIVSTVLISILGSLLVAIIIIQLVKRRKNPLTGNIPKKAALKVQKDGAE